LWMKVAEYVGRYPLDLQLLCQALKYHRLLWVACVLLTACEGALEPSLLVEPP
jgi:hypothetical protein